MKTGKVLTTGAILLAAASIFGFNDTALRVRAGLAGLRQAVDESSSNSQLLRVARAQLDKAGKVQSDAEFTVQNLARDGEKIESEMARLKTESGTARARLVKLRPALTAKSGLEIAGVTYSAEEVEGEARQLAGFVVASENDVDQKNTRLKEVRRSIAGAEGELKKSRASMETAQAHFQELETKLRLAEASREATSAAEDTRTVLASDSEGGFSKTVKILEKRLFELQHEPSDSDRRLPRSTILWERNAERDDGQEGRETREYVSTVPRYAEAYGHRCSRQ